MPKWTKNQWKIDQQLVKIEVWRRLGASCGIFRCLEGTQDGQKTPQNASWGVLARKRWPTWLQLGSQNGAKIEKKSKQKSIEILMLLGVGFWSDLDGFLDPSCPPTWLPKASQIISKTLSTYCLLLASFFHCFVVEFAHTGALRKQRFIL